MDLRKHIGDLWQCLKMCGIKKKRCVCESIYQLLRWRRIVANDSTLLNLGAETFQHHVLRRNGLIHLIQLGLEVFLWLTHFFMVFELMLL